MPRTCVTAQQIERRPSHANPTYVRLGGGRHLLRVRLYGYAQRPCTRTSVYHGHTCTGIRASSRARARACLHHGHTCTATSTSGHAFDETSADGFNRSSSNPTHSNSNVQRLGGMGMASLGDAATTPRRRCDVSTTGGSQHLHV